MKWWDRLALLVLGLGWVVLLAAAGSAFCRQAEPAAVSEPPRAAWDDMDAAQLSWVIEGIQERMSDLADDLHYAQHLQAQKLNGQ